ncbi:MAG: 50S ribosomal protein L25 [Deltaproteobacteria bacterium]|nr:50S ribosomal protein L25 [Deltaproteobacteria bacterium]
MAENALNVETRQGAGKGVARKLRAAGRIPGVCYGKGEPSFSISLDPRALRHLLEQSEAGMNTLINLAVEGGGSFDGKMVLVRELQKDPVEGSYLHADFFAVDVQHAVEVSVPIHIIGRAPGVELGGILDQALREIDLECLPLAIPSEIVADVSELDVGQSLHVSDLALPEGVELRSDPGLSVVSVVAPAKVEEVVEEAEVEGEGEVEGEEAAAEDKEGAAEASEEAKDKKSGD